MLNDYLKRTYGRKLYKISIDAGFTCPNRDGTCGYGGCIFCSEGGSGDFAERAKTIVGCGRVTGGSAGAVIGNGIDAGWKADIGVNTDIADKTYAGEWKTKGWLDEAIASGKKRVEAKFHPQYPGANYIAYFQAFTNTYAPVYELRQIYEPVIENPDIAILSIATRPDCVEADVIELLRRLNEKKPVWVELGLQTIHEKTAEFINRGYRTSKYDEAVRRLSEAGINVVTHVILGLPGESREDMLKTVTHVSKMRSWGIKLQMLHILKGTKLAQIYEEDPFPVFTLEEYAELIGEILKILPEDMVIHRLTGDGPKKLLIAPEWSADKKRVLNALKK